MSGSAVSRRAPVYLDHAATTPVDPVVAASMLECLGHEGVFGNASSGTHAYGREAAARVEQARAQVAALLGAQPDEIVFTSGATESNNLALQGAMRANAHRGRHLVTARTEHKAVLDVVRQLEKDGCSVTWLEPDRNGLVSPGQVAEALRPDTQLVSLMQANNETGVVQDIAAIAAVCLSRGVLLHTDAAQSAAQLCIDVAALQVDFLSLTAHKFYGPKGSGALYVARRARPRLAPIMQGGGHERGMRPGTVATHQVVGLGAAAQRLGDTRDADALRIAMMRDQLQGALLELPGVHLNGHRERRLPGLLNLSFEGVEGESLLAGLYGEVAVSSGAACDSATGEPSYVLRALGRSSQLAQASLRFSLGRHTTAADIDRATEAVRHAVQRLRAAAP